MRRMQKLSGMTIAKMYRNPNARELMIGIVRDPVFGPVISFGSGGTMVEVMGDSAISLPPLNRRLAQDLIDRTKASKMLGNFRNMPAVNMERLIDVLVNVSNMACELPWIREMDINPLLVDENGCRGSGCAYPGRTIQNHRPIPTTTWPFILIRFISSPTSN